MSNEKGRQLWAVNIASFALVAILALTGLVNWLVLPRGYAVAAGWIVSLRHLVRGLHQWSALLFLACLAVHLLLHRTYLSRQLKKHGIIK